MNHNETLDAILQAGTMPDAVIRLDGSMFVGADSNPLGTLARLCGGEGGAGLEELAALTGLAPDALQSADLPNLDKDTVLIALGKLVRVWFAVERNHLAEAAGLTGREPLPGVMPAALAEALQRITPVRIAPAKVAA